MDEFIAGFPKFYAATKVKKVKTYSKNLSAYEFFYKSKQPEVGTSLLLIQFSPSPPD